MLQDSSEESNIYAKYKDDLHPAYVHASKEEGLKVKDSRGSLSKN